MAYCVICGRQHGPEVLCSDGGGQALSGAGIGNRGHVTAHELRRIARLADRWILKALLLLLVMIVAISILVAIFEKKAF